MTTIPENTVTQQDLIQWYELVDKLKKIKTAEMILRLKIFKHYFPEPKEGVNTFVLPDSYLLKGDYSYDRNVDEAALVTLTPMLQDKGINLDVLIRRKPELALKEYRTLEKDQTEEGVQKLRLFDQCLIIKPSTPSLKIVDPPKPKVVGKTK